MDTVLKLTADLQITLEQLVSLAKQLSPGDKTKLVSLILEDEEIRLHDELVTRITEGLEEVKLHKEGKIKLNTLSEFLTHI